MHKDIVHDHPTGVESLGSSPVCDVQGMYVPNRLISVQGHPEFDDEMVTAICEKRHEQGIFDDETFTDAISRVKNEQDGVTVAQGFLKMLTG